MNNLPCQKDVKGFKTHVSKQVLIALNQENCIKIILNKWKFESKKGNLLSKSDHYTSVGWMKLQRCRTSGRSWQSPVILLKIFWVIS